MRDEKWQRFEQTGNVMDYLRYCAREEYEKNQTMKQENVGGDGRESKCNGTGTFISTGWRV